MVKYEVVITFKHLPHWRKTQRIEAKSPKKAEDIVKRMYRDNIKNLEINEIN